MLQVAVNGSEIRVVEMPEPVVRHRAARTSRSLTSARTESAGIGSAGRRENLVLKPIGSGDSFVYTVSGGSGLGGDRLKVLAGGEASLGVSLGVTAEDELQATWCAEITRGSGGTAL